MRTIVRLRLLLSLLVLPGLAAPAAAQPAFQVADLGTQLSSSSSQQFPYPAEFAQLGSAVIFTASDGIHGLELWITDGTTAGTHLVADICPGVCGSSPFEFTPLGSRILFRAGDGAHGHELWETDGTAAGTRNDRRVIADGHWYFRALTGGDLKYWISDGTTAGTQLLATINTQSSAFSIWSFGPTLEAGAIVPFQGGVAFPVEDGSFHADIWKTDGTPSGTFQLDGASGSDPLTFHTPAGLGSSLFFTAEDGVHGAEVWKSDGQPGDAAMFQDLSQQGIYELVRSGDRLFFPANGQIWSTDGTLAGTTAAAGSSHEAGGLIAHTPGRIAYSGSTPATGVELWGADAGSSAPVADINPGAGSSYLESLLSVGPVIYFFAYDGTTGRELWKSDGVSSAERVKDIRPGPASATRLLTTPENFTMRENASLGTRVFFAANDGVDGEELWVSDGTEAGTVRLADINPGAGSSQPQWLTRVRNKASPADAATSISAPTGRSPAPSWRSSCCAPGSAWISSRRPAPAGYSAMCPPTTGRATGSSTSPPSA